MTKERGLGLAGPVKALVIALCHACAFYGVLRFGEPITPCSALDAFVQWLPTVRMPLLLLVLVYIWTYLKMGMRKHDDARCSQEEDWLEIC